MAGQVASSPLLGRRTAGRQLRPGPRGPARPTLGSPAGCGSANVAPLHRPCGAGDRSGPLRTLQ
jgi:hypothetical protein